MEIIPHIIISTVYHHHAKDSGYIRLAKYTKPLNEIILKDDLAKKYSLLNKYRFLNELLIPLKLSSETKLIHLYFAEEYLRFSPYLFSNIPIIGTFHQPPELLEKEVLYGNYQGRVYGIAHQLTKKRFQKLAAAIILDENQRSVMEKVMPAKKIHLIPHGIDDINMQRITYTTPLKKDKYLVLTVGNWQRNWQQYEDILRYFDQQRSGIIFRLVSRNTDEAIIQRLKQYQCFEYERQVSAEKLRQLYLDALLLLLPLKAGTANNALLEGLNYGVPVLISDVFDNPLYQESEGLELIADTPTFIQRINSIRMISAEEYAQKQKAAKQLGQSFTWSNIAEKIMSLYQQVCSNSSK